MKTEIEYNEITNERLEKMVYTGEANKTIQILLYWSYIEGSRDADIDMVEKLRSLGK